MELEAIIDDLRNRVATLESDVIYIGSEIQRVEGELAGKMDELRDQQENVKAHLDDAARQLDYALNLARTS